MLRRTPYPLSLQFIKPTSILFAESNRRRKHLSRVSYGDETNPLSKPTIIDKATLYIVPTPIGNIKDFSLRSLEVIRQVDYLFCINKIATQVLMDIIDINCSGRLLQYNKHARSQARLAELVKGGSSAALLAPQGMPIVGDQGVDVVQRFLKEGVRVSCLPGPAACVTALAMSGSNGSEDAFFFGGHLSLQRATRLRQIKEIEKSRCPTVFYEATPRLRTSLEEIAIICGPTRKVSVVHEISKIHEATHRDEVMKLVHFYSKQENRAVDTKGQATVIVDADPIRERRGHLVMSSAARNEWMQMRSIRNKPELGESFVPKIEGEDESFEIQKQRESLTQTKELMSSTSMNEKANHDVILPSSSMMTFREKVLSRLVQEELISRKLQQQRQKDQASSSSSSSSDVAMSGIVEFVAKEMNASIDEVLAACEKMHEEETSSDFSPSHRISSKSNVTDDETEPDDDEDDCYKAEFESLASSQDISTMKKMELLKTSSSTKDDKNDSSKKSSSKFNLVKQFDEIRQVKVEGDQHFPMDWIPEVEEEQEEDEKVEQQEFPASVSSSLASNVNENKSPHTIENVSSSSSTEDKKSRRRLEAKKKLMRALASQSLKTKLARKQLSDEKKRF